MMNTSVELNGRGRSTASVYPRVTFSLDAPSKEAVAAFANPSGVTIKVPISGSCTNLPENVKPEHLKCDVKLFAGPDGKDFVRSVEDANVVLNKKITLQKMLLVTQITDFPPATNYFK